VAGYCAKARPNEPIRVSQAGGGVKCNFLVVDGDVELGNQFDGIIMCSGMLNTGGASLHLQMDGISYLRNSDLWNGTRGGSGLSKGDDWAMDEVVTYSNWKKD
jgi:hypothetical protein